jgi:uncharacterized delta-60 repeat protein
VTHRFAWVVVVAVLTSHAIAVANPGDLDPSFGSGGMVTTPLGAEDTDSVGLVQQLDGKLLMAANTLSLYSPGDAWGGVVRYNTDGSLDTSFGNRGIVWISNASVQAVNGISLQSDGKIIAVGCSYGGSSSTFYLTRLTTAGAVDTHFGNNGEVRTSVTSYPDCATAVAVQPDDKIIAAGFVFLEDGSFCGAEHLTLARYQRNGQLDTTFGTGGKVETDAPAQLVTPNKVVVQADGRIVVVGASPNTYCTNGFVMRFNANGSVDSAYQNGGVAAVTDFSPLGSALESDGKLLLAGYPYDWSVPPWVMRLDIGGNLDTTFGHQGFGSGGCGAGWAYKALNVQPDGQVIVFGTSKVGAASFTRFRPDGNVDPAVQCRGARIYAESLLVQADGKLVAAGGDNNGVMTVGRFFANTCGNGVLEPGEDCDDGNTRSGDCCSSTCGFEPAGFVCVATGCTAGRCDGAGSCHVQ